MDKITKESALSKSAEIVAENIDKLKSLFPEVITEGEVDGEPHKKIDFDALKEVLGDYVEDREERYNFTWHGKANVRRLAQMPSAGTLRPSKDESVDWEATQNLFIEGDNLEVLKLLQKSYHKKIKMIYIDPPYNTGKEFIYPDKYQDNLDTYLKYTGQVNDDGFKISANTETTGRYHTNWLNMMYPRIRLARNLLTEDGVIFISIDNNEVVNLQIICSEIFGDECFLGKVVWKNSTDNNPTNVATEHEYILVYCKNKSIVESVWKSSVSDIKELLVNTGTKLTDKFSDKEKLEKEYKIWFKENKNQLWPLDRYKYIDEDGIYTGSQSVHNPGKEGYRYDVIHPVTNKPCKEPLMGYRFPEVTMNDLLDNEKILFGDDENKIIELKLYASDYLEKLSGIIELDGRLGAYEVRELFPEYTKAFTNPKPTRLLESFIPFLAKEDGDIVLDFFAGSASTADAVMNVGMKENARLRFIMVQLPEKCEEKSEPFKNGVELLTTISKERIRRAANKIKEKNPSYEGDLGFKVFKLDATNINSWEANFDNLEAVLDNSTDSIKSGRNAEDVLYEILLKYGLDLTLPIEEHSIIDKTVYSVGMGALLVCLDDEIPLEVAEGIGKLKEKLQPEVMRVVFKDAGFADDVVKTNTIQVLKQFGIDDVKSI